MIRKRPFLWIFILFGLGILIQHSLRIPLWVLIPLTAGFLLAVFLIPRRGRLSLVCLAASLILLGGLYNYSTCKFPRDHIYYQRSLLYGKEISIKGIIISHVKKKEILRGNKTTFTLAVKGFDDGEISRPARGKVLVNLFQDRPLEYGDAIMIKGKLHRPYEFSRSQKFSFRRYLRHKGIYWIFSVAKKNPVYVTARGKGNKIMALALRLREYLGDIFYRRLTPREAGLMQAIILGDRSQLAGHINALFKRTGTAHVLAISGLHVGIVAVLFFLFLKLLPLKRQMQVILAIILLAGYALVTGGRPSVVRAAVMASVFLFSFVIERETDSLNSLSLAGFLLLLLDPMNMFDAGFQLSFASVFAIILFYPRIWAGFQLLPFSWKNKTLKFLFQSLAASLAAWMGVAGLIAYYFDIVTPITILANILVIPLISVIVALGAGLIMVSFGLPFLSIFFAVCIKFVLNLMVVSIFVLDRIPGAYFQLRNFPWQAAVGYYLVLVAGVDVMQFRGRRLELQDGEK